MMTAFFSKANNQPRELEKVFEGEGRVDKIKITETGLMVETSTKEDAHSVMETLKLKNTLEETDIPFSSPSDTTIQMAFNKESINMLSCCHYISVETYFCLLSLDASMEFSRNRDAAPESPQHAVTKGVAQKSRKELACTLEESRVSL
jgi:hypothetical protein